MFRPGAQILERELWPSADWPPEPVLVEYAGNEAPARGKRRREQPDRYIVWKYDARIGEFVNVLDFSSTGAGDWPFQIEAVCSDLTSRSLIGPRPLPTIEDVRIEVATFLEEQFSKLNSQDQARLVNMIFTDFASKLTVNRAA